MGTTTILVVDDEPQMLETLCETLRRQKFAVEPASDGAAAMGKLKERPFDMVITDLKMPKATGMDILRAVKRLAPGTPVVMITGYGTISGAVEAMKEGAFDYITKPFSQDEIRLVIDKAFELRRLREENRALRAELESRYSFQNIVGKSERMKTIFETIEIVAPSRSTVLIHGESGTGKELVARAIHYASARKDHPFVKLNCAAIPEGLMESELFGHEKGAFTGAIRRTKGRFERADRGTLLLDEISEMSFGLQAKLLRVLQEQEFERVGDGETLRVDVRIVATTNRKLKEEIEKGRFREDLYYRLNVVPIHLPPLRERREDVPLLAEYFLRHFAEENGKKIKGFSPDALDLLLRMDWPGNVRELEHCVERAVVIAQGETILPRHLLVEEQERGRPLLRPESGRPLRLDEMERQMIFEGLEREGGNKTRAAKALGISVRTLRNKLNRYQREAGKPGKGKGGA